MTMNGHIPNAVGWGWSADDLSPLSLAIRYFTRPDWSLRPLARWSHMFMVYAFDDQASNCVHEALGSRGWTSSPVRHLAEWHATDPGNCPLAIEWLTLTPETISAIWTESCDWIGTESYAYRQLAFFGLAETIPGRALCAIAPGVFERDVDDNEVICSEGCCRIVGERVPYLDLRKAGEPWAMISPQAAWNRYQDLLVRRRAAAAAH